MHLVSALYLVCQLFAWKYWFPLFLTKGWPTNRTTDQPTDWPTDRPTERPGYRTHLKREKTQWTTMRPQFLSLWISSWPQILGLFFFAERKHQLANWPTSWWADKPINGFLSSMHILVHGGWMIFWWLQWAYKVLEDLRGSQRVTARSRESLPMVWNCLCFTYNSLGSLWKICFSDR